MDQIRIGKFIAGLRRAAGLTQEALGERLGVTNKTISRWETGSYMPDIEMLQLLSREFGVSIDELLAGERLPVTPEQAVEESAVTTPKSDTFSLVERTAYYKRKWRREHLALIIFLPVVLAAIAALAIINRQPAFFGLLPVLALIGYGYLRNRMMAYVEHSLYD